MIVEISTRYSDTCGNDAYYHYGYFECDSIEEAREIFPSGFLCGWVVNPLRLQKLPESTPKFPKEP